MENSLCLLPDLIECIIKFGTLLITFATAVVIIGYWFKPCFNITIDKVQPTFTQIRVTVINSNLFCNKIKDIDCELTLSKDKSFSDEVRTLELIKPWIVCLKRKPAYYVFKADLNIEKYPSNNIKDMKFLRVRLLAPNFLGIKKVKEEIIEI